MKKSADKFYILQAAQKDLNLIAVLGAITFYETYFEVDDKPLDLADYIVKNFNPSVIESEFKSPDSTFFVAYLNDKAIGYAKLRQNSKVDCISEANIIELQRIYFLQKMWGKGFGDKMLRHCLEEASRKGFQCIWLSVWEHNLNAQRFYKKQGFVHVGNMPYPYGAEIATNFVMKKDYKMLLSTLIQSLL